MNLGTLQRLIATGCVVAICVPRPHAMASSPVVERFAARALSPGDGGIGRKIDIFIERWSSDAERDTLGEALTGSGPELLLPALQNLRRRAGTLLIPGIRGRGARVRMRQPRNLLFARDVVTPTGRQVILVADHGLAFGEPTEKWPSDFTFTLLDIRFGADGTGIGKVAPAGAINFNAKTRMLEAANFEALPVALRAVRSEKLEESSTVPQ